STLLWGGLVRIFLLHHVTWSTNSICHFFGRQRFEAKDESTNVWVLSLVSMGESWHHNHHTFPTSAFHGLRFWERMTDPTGWMILTLERMGVIWNVVRVSPEKQSAKLKSAVSGAAQAAGGLAASETRAPSATRTA
ncbi:MAG: acyl-CoA desaturase, partial [Solirubrobacteraceae bacterium]